MVVLISFFVFLFIPGCSDSSISQNENQNNLQHPPYEQPQQLVVSNSINSKKSLLSRDLKPISPSKQLEIDKKKRLQDESQSQKQAEKKLEKKSDKALTIHRFFIDPRIFHTGGGLAFNCELKNTSQTTISASEQYKISFILNDILCTSSSPTSLTLGPGESQKFLTTETNVPESIKEKGNIVLAKLMKNKAGNWEEVDKIKIQFDIGNNEGLLGEYFHDKHMEDTAFVRLDKEIDFTWNSDTEVIKISQDIFAVEWMGFIDIPKTGMYSFTVQTEGLVKLWINQEQVISQWKSVANDDVITGNTFLVGGKKVPIILEYRDFKSNGRIKLLWGLKNENAEVLKSPSLIPFSQFQ